MGCVPFTLPRSKRPKATRETWAIDPRRDARQFAGILHSIPRRKRDGSPIRVGFASSMLHDHTITYLFGSWMKGLASRGFELHGYLIGSRPDDVSHELAALCKQFNVLPNDTKSCAQKIRGDALDVLIYPELGMNRHLLKLAALRLAPTQAVTWGHPVTTGLPNIDTFLSSEQMEPIEGEHHYTETLLKPLGCHYISQSWRHHSASRLRKDFGLPEDATLFLIPQSLFKLIPEHDWIYGAIAQPASCTFLFSRKSGRKWHNRCRGNRSKTSAKGLYRRGTIRGSIYIIAGCEPRTLSGLECLRRYFSRCTRLVRRSDNLGRSGVWPTPHHLSGPSYASTTHCRHPSRIGMVRPHRGLASSLCGFGNTPRFRSVLATKIAYRTTHAHP